MTEHRLISISGRAELVQVTTTNKRSRWVCEQCKRQYCGAKPCPFCYRNIIAEESIKSESL